MRNITKAVDKKQNNITEKIFLLSRIRDLFVRYFTAQEDLVVADLSGSGFSRFGIVRQMNPL